MVIIQLNIIVLCVILLLIPCIIVCYCNYCIYFLFLRRARAARGARSGSQNMTWRDTFFSLRSPVYYCHHLPLQFYRHATWQCGIIFSRGLALFACWQRVRLGSTFFCARAAFAFCAAATRCCSCLLVCRQQLRLAFAGVGVTWHLARASVSGSTISLAFGA